jgi:hypothetical protein
LFVDFLLALTRCFEQIEKPLQSVIDKQANFPVVCEHRLLANMRRAIQPVHGLDQRAANRPVIKLERLTHKIDR